MLPTFFRRLPAQHQGKSQTLKFVENTFSNEFRLLKYVGYEDEIHNCRLILSEFFRNAFSAR